MSYLVDDEKTVDLDTFLSKVEHEGWAYAVEQYGSDICRHWPAIADARNAWLEIDKRLVSLVLTAAKSVGLDDDGYASDLLSD